MDPGLAVQPTRDVLRTFNLGTPTGAPAEVARGAMGRVFRVETSTGVWAVKRLLERSHTPAEHLERQVSFVEAASAAGVATPRIIRSVDGRIAVSIDGVRWRAFEWIDIVGTPTLHQAGATLARLHAAGWPTTEPVDPRYTRRTFGGSWEALLDRARGQPCAPLLREQIPELEALDAIPARATLPPCRMCHRDFNESDLAIDRVGRVVVLDWDDSGPLPPEWEVGHVLLDAGRQHWHLNTTAGVRELVAAYRREGGVFAPTGLEVFSSSIAAHHNFLAKMILESLAGDRWALQAVESMLAHPFTLAFLRKTLDAVP